MLHKIHSSLQLCVHMKGGILLVSDVVVYQFGVSIFIPKETV